MTNLTIQLAPLHPNGLLLENPVIAASGTSGYGIEQNGLLEVDELGAIICKGTTFEPRTGNPQPRIFETASGILNSIGLQNTGIEILIKEKAPVWAKSKVPVIVNVAGATIEEYVKIATRLEGVAGISGIELNISCPNVKAGGMEFGSNPRIAAEVTGAVKSVTSLPLIVKLTPNVTDISEIAVAVCEVGADALTLINTLRGTAIDVDTGKPVLGGIYGGLSGPSIKPVALAMVYRVTEIIKVPIIGSGGIWNWRDAIEFFMAGATAIQIGSAFLHNPAAPKEILEGIRVFLDRKGYKSINDIVGIAHK